MKLVVLHTWKWACETTWSIGWRCPTTSVSR